MGSSPRVTLPFYTSTIGAQLNAKAKKPTNYSPIWKPNLVYMLWLASGKNAAKMFSPKQTAAEALGVFGISVRDVHHDSLQNHHTAEPDE